MFEPDKPKAICYLIFGILSLVAIWQFLADTPTVDIQVQPAYILNSQNYSYTYDLQKLPQFDYNRLIDLDFSFNILSHVCNDSSSPLLLIMVHSAPKNSRKRNVIRQTWGKYGDYFKLAFAIGSVNSSDLQNAIEEENRIFNDIVQGNFTDTYRNITYKHVMVFKYTIYHCPLAKYVLKIDDDVFVNVPQMRNFLTGDLTAYGAKRMLFCTPRRNKIVLRTYRSKWRVSFSEYPNKTYPTYCPGWTLLYSPDVVFTLYEQAQSSPYFWIDDVHITGTLAKKCNIVHSNIEPLLISKKDMRNVVEYESYNMSKPFLFGRPNLNEKQIRVLWKYVKLHPPATLLLSHEGIT